MGDISNILGDTVLFDAVCVPDQFDTFFSSCNYAVQ